MFNFLKETFLEGVGNPTVITWIKRTTEHRLVLFLTGGKEIEEFKDVLTEGWGKEFILLLDFISLLLGSKLSFLPNEFSRL